MNVIHFSVIDWIIMAVYIAFIIWIGFYLKKYVKSDKDFFLAGRKNSAWVAGVAFMSANMGAMEVMGYSGLTAKYGIFVGHFYLIGAIPAMLFLGVFMMPFYYKNKIKSVPGYIKERFDEKTRLLNAISFAVMMVLVSGIALYALALVLHTFIGWDWNLSIWVSAGLVALYVSLSGLLSAIFTEVIQFFLIWAGILLIPISGLIDFGGPHQIASRLSDVYTHLWSITGAASHNPMGVTWYGLVLGLGFAVSFGYWTTDFLIIQRAFSAKDLRSAQLAPIIGTFFKMLLGVAVVGSGLVGLSLLQDPNSGFALLHQGGKVNYDSIVPLLMMRYFPSGMIGLGVTTLVAMFMAGQAGNMSAFSAVWTYDIYQAVIDRKASREKLVWVGRVATIVGIILSIGAAYWARSMPTIIDFLQAIVSFILAPTAAVILLGMFSKKVTPTAAFWGMLVGMVSSLIMFVLLEFGLITPGAITPAPGPGSVMAANFWRAWWAMMIAGGVTIGGSFFTAGRPVEELKGLVKGLGTDKPPVEGEGMAYGLKQQMEEGSTNTAVETVLATHKFYKTPEFWAAVSLAIFVAWNIYFW
jgi:SSS family solute:Na+ symporter